MKKTNRKLIRLAKKLARDKIKYERKYEKFKYNCCDRLK